MTAYRTVVVGTDGSESSLRAVERAATIAADSNAKLIIGTATPPPGRFARGRRPRGGGLQGAGQRARLRDAARCPRPGKGGRGEEHRGSPG